MQESRLFKREDTATVCPAQLHIICHIIIHTEKAGQREKMFGVTLPCKRAPHLDSHQTKMLKVQKPLYLVCLETPQVPKKSLKSGNAKALTLQGSSSFLNDYHIRNRVLSHLSLSNCKFCHRILVTACTLLTRPEHLSASAHLAAG